MDLLDQLKRPERRLLEFKRDLSSPDGALNTIVAVANPAGGTLLIGVEDRSRHVRGVADHQGKTLPTVGGMIRFGHDRERHFPDAWIQAGRFAGDPRLPLQAVENAIAFVQQHFGPSATIGAVRRTDRWTLPAEAVREALIHAVVYTDYSQRGAPIRLSIFDDRLEIENPGLTPSASWWRISPMACQSCTTA